MRTRTGVADSLFPRLVSARDRVSGRGEDAEERIALRVGLDAVVCCDCVPDQLMMLSQHPPHTVLAHLGEQLSRSLDVGEEEREGSRWKIGPHTPRLRRARAGSRPRGYVDFRGCRTWYRVAGDLGSGATPLLALHGGPGSTHHYFAPLEQLADRRPVVVYDQLGCGSSDRPDDVEWSVDVFRAEVAAVRAQLGLGRIHLLGTSWGGMLALEHVLSGAEGVVGLVLSSTLASLDEWAREQKRLRNDLPRDVVAVLDRHEEAGTTTTPSTSARWASTSNATSTVAARGPSSSA